MDGSTVRRVRLRGTPEWVFRWKPRRSPWLPKLLAIALVGTFFAILMTLQIRVTGPSKMAPRAASVIVLGNDPDSRALKLRADEGGPFPSRFELSQWEGMADLEAKAWQAAEYQPKPYVPTMLELPDANLLRPLELAVKGKSFFPKRVLEDEPLPVERLPTKLQPFLFPLSGITEKDLPADLPEFDAVAEAADWRFLLKLNPLGAVTECISLETTGEAAPTALEQWIRQLTFKPVATQTSRWIAVGIQFTNAATHGTVAR